MESAIANALASGTRGAGRRPEAGAALASGEAVSTPPRGCRWNTDTTPVSLQLVQLRQPCPHVPVTLLVMLAPPSVTHMVHVLSQTSHNWLQNKRLTRVIPIPIKTRGRTRETRHFTQMLWRLFHRRVLSLSRFWPTVVPHRIRRVNV